MTCPTAIHVQLEANRGDAVIKMKEKWYYTIMGEVYGPVSPRQLRRLVRDNEIGRETFVREGQGDWISAESVAGLFPSRPMSHAAPRDRWYFRVMGEIRGPMAFAALRRLVTQNEIGRDTFVRRNDEDWVTADCVKELFQPFAMPRAIARDQWYFRVMGEVRGPMALPALRRLAAQNEIGRDTFVRRNDEDWVTADRVEDLLH